MALQTKSGLVALAPGVKETVRDAAKSGALAAKTKGQTKAQMNTQLSNGGYTNDSNGGGGGYGGGGGGGYSDDYESNSYADYLAALQAQRDALISQANAALDEQGRLAENRYKLQKEASDQDYQDLRNQSEVNRYKARGTLRQSLADRGAMDSGVGRQAYVSLANNYDNALNKIGLQQKREDAERNQAIQEMWAQIAMQKVANQMSGLDMMGNVLSQLDPSMFQSSINTSGGYSYSPNSSSYYQQASDSVAPVDTSGLASRIGNAVNTPGASQAARAKAFDDLVAASMRYNPFNEPWKY